MQGIKRDIGIDYDFSVARKSNQLGDFKFRYFFRDAVIPIIKFLRRAGNVVLPTRHRVEIIQVWLILFVNGGQDRVHVVIFFAVQHVVLF